MKSFFLAAQAAAAEADEQRRFCSGAVQYSCGVVIDGSLVASASFLSVFPGTGHLLTCERFRGRFFFQGNFSGDVPKSRGNSKRGKLCTVGGRK